MDGWDGYVRKCILPCEFPPELAGACFAQVRAVFSSSKRNVAGCMVTEGVLRKNATIVVRRGKRVVFDGPISSLRRVKEIVNEVRPVQLPLTE